MQERMVIMKKKHRIAALFMSCSVLLTGCASPKTPARHSKKQESSVSEQPAAVLTELSDEKNAAVLMTELKDDISVLNADDAYEEIVRNTGLRDNENNNLELKTQSEVKGNSVYRFQQTYKELPVYGREVVLTADSAHKASLLSSNLDAFGDIGTSPQIGSQEIKEIAQKQLSDPAGEQIFSEPELCIYSFSDPSVLAYKVAAVSHTSFFDANTGTLLGSVQNYSDVKMQGELKEYDLDAKETDYTVEFYDENRKIAVNKLKSKFWLNPDDYEVYKVNKTFQKGSHDTEVAVELLGNLEKIYDYFGKTIGYYSLDGKGSQLNAYFYVGYIPGIGSMSDNAFYWDGTDLGYGEMIAICPYTYFQYCLGAYEDVMAHEFTHAIVNHTAGFYVNGQSRAMNEGFADILGECAEAAINHRDIDWILGNELSLRDINDLSKSTENTKHISKYSEYGGSLDCHGASTLITGVARNIYLGTETDGFSAEETRVSDPELMTMLWYMALLQMHSNATFMDCRTAVEFAADLLGLSEAQKKGIAKVFDNAGMTLSKEKEEPQTAEQTDPAVLYAEVLENFAKEHGYPEKNPQNEAENAMYNLIDFNNDGIPELYLYGKEDNQYSMIIQIYTLKNNQPALVYQQNNVNATSADDYCVVLYSIAEKQYYIYTYQWNVFGNSYCKYRFDGEKFVGAGKRTFCVGEWGFGKKVTEPVSFRGHSYIICEAYCDEDSVADYCREIGGYYAHINDKEENDFLAETVRNAGIEFAYFGYSDKQEEGNWQWLDHEESAFTNWKQGEPNNEAGEEHYALLFGDGQWNDGKFNRDVSENKTYVICEYNNPDTKPYDPEFPDFKVEWDSRQEDFDEWFFKIETGKDEKGNEGILNYGGGMFFIHGDRYHDSLTTYKRITGKSFE